MPGGHFGYDFLFPPSSEVGGRRGGVLAGGQGFGLYVWQIEGAGGGLSEEEVVGKFLFLGRGPKFPPSLGQGKHSLSLGNAKQETSRSS